MRHLKKVISALLLLPLFSVAQSNYKPGYVVTAKGDTLRGFIDYKGWSSNPTAISFKYSTADHQTQTFTVSNINAFNVDRLATYKKYICSISMDDVNTLRLGSSRDTSYKIDTVFLKILQKGQNVALYQYSDALKTRFYVGESPDYVPAELAYRIYDNNGSSRIENTYQKRLFALANKYNVLDDKLVRTLQSATYSKADLLTIVTRINKISKTDLEKHAQDKISLYIGGALNVSVTSADASTSYMAGGGTSYTSYLPAVFAGVNIIPSAGTGRVELRAELSFAETQFRSSYTLKVNPFVGEKAAFNQLGISIIPQVIYNFYNSENFKVYAGLGFAGTHFIYTNAFFGPQDPNKPDNDIGKNDPYFFNENGSEILLKLGMKIHKKFEMFFNYFTDSNTTKGGYFSFVDSQKQVGLIYLF